MLVSAAFRRIVLPSVVMRVRFPSPARFDHSELQKGMNDIAR